jgi:FAD/FMN-containing dehydrogenase
MVPFDLLSCDGLTVITKEDERFDVAVTSRAFISNLPSSDKFPDAVLVATNTHAVQVAVNFCRKYNYRVSPRTGGHNWFNIWLQGNVSIILDVGDINQVEFHTDTETIIAGPGATNISDQIPKDFFFPSGHGTTRRLYIR